MLLRQIEDRGLAQYAYLIGCQRTGEALVIDPERDIDRYQALAAENGLTITSVAETHIHADFVSGSQEFAVNPNIHFYLSGVGGADWSYRWPGKDLQVTYLKHEDEFRVGGIRVQALHTPGHTPEHLSFLITGEGGGASAPIALATGDFLFVGDVGRPDLLETAAGVAGVMQASAEQLQASLSARLRKLEDYVQILPGHGAGSACGKALGAVPFSVIGYERRFNRALRMALENAQAFVADILSGQPAPPLYFARMKQVNRDGIAVTGGPPKVKPLCVEEGVALAEERRAVVVDGRKSGMEFAEGHLPGSIHAPFPGAFYTASVGSYAAHDDSLLLIAQREDPVDEMVRQLYRIGFDRIVGFAYADELETAGAFRSRLKRVEFGDWKTTELSPDDRILDVRNESEFEAGHLPNAKNIPYTRLRARLDELPQGETLYVHCGSGMRASLAASFLRVHGFDAIYVDGVCSDCKRIAETQGVAH